MPGKLRYSSMIKDMTLLFLEMRKGAELVCEGCDPENIIALSVERNIFQLTKERRRRDLARRIVTRLNALTDKQISALAKEQEDVAKLVAFYSIIKTDLLFYEFMRDVYSEKITIHLRDISDTDIVSFLRSKEEISKWSDNNFAQVKNAYKTILCSVGLAERNGLDLVIRRPYIDDTLKDVFSVSDEYTCAMGV